jgi:hypothetical protein
MKIKKEKPVIVVGPGARNRKIKAVRMSDKPLMLVGLAAVRKGIVSW